MGPELTKLNANQDMLNQISNNKELLKTVFKETVLGEGYTERYDHGTIDKSALVELVNSANFVIPESLFEKIGALYENN